MIAPAATATATASPIRRPLRNVRSNLQAHQFQESGSALDNASCLQLRLLPDDDLGADRHALVKVSNIGVDQPEAAGGNGSADRVGPIGPVNAIDGGAEIHGPSPERIAGTTGHEAR